MYPTLKLVKYSLLVAIHITSCCFILLAGINDKIVDQTVSLEINENSEQLELNSSILESFFYFEEEAIVEFENLEIGSLVTTEVRLLQ